MPTFQVTDPQSGVTLELTGSIAPTERELDEIFYHHRLASDVGMGEAIAIGAGRGLTTIGRALGLAEPESPVVTEAIDALKEQRPVSTLVGEVAGESAPFLPLAAVLGPMTSRGMQVAGTAAIGALEGFLISRGLGGTSEEQVISGGIGGTAAGVAEMVLPRLLRSAGKLYRRVVGKSPVGALVDDMGNPTDELVMALNESGQTFDDLADEAIAELGSTTGNPKDAARRAFLESQGIKPTKAQITRDPRDFQLQQEAAKTSSGVRDVLEGQEAVLTSRFNNAILDTGGDIETDVSTPIDAVVSKATVLDAQIGDLYKVAREIASGEKSVRFDRLTAKLKELAPSNRRTGGNIEAILGDMQSKGAVGSDFNITGRVDVDTAEDIRKLMNELYDPKNEFGNMKLRELKDALDDDVFRAAGKDVYKMARKAKTDFENGLKRAGLSKFDSRKANIVRDILENKVNPDNFANDVVFSKKWRSEDINQLKSYLLDGTPEQKSVGSQAWNDLRADVMTAIKEKSFIGPEDAEGIQALSRDKLQRAIQSIGTPKIKQLFTKQEQKFLADMLEVAKLREPVRGTSLGKGPSAQAVQGLMNRLEKLPLLSSIIDAFDLDPRGRVVIMAKPRSVRPPALTGTTSISPVAGVAAVGINEENK